MRPYMRNWRWEVNGNDFLHLVSDGYGSNELILFNFNVKFLKRFQIKNLIIKT